MNPHNTQTIVYNGKEIPLVFSNETIADLELSLGPRILFECIENLGRGLPSFAFTRAGLVAAVAHNGHKWKLTPKLASEIIEAVGFVEVAGKIAAGVAVYMNGLTPQSDETSPFDDTGGDAPRRGDDSSEAKSPFGPDAGSTGAS